MTLGGAQATKPSLRATPVTSALTPACAGVAVAWATGNVPGRYWGVAALSLAASSAGARVRSFASIPCAPDPRADPDPVVSGPGWPVLCVRLGRRRAPRPGRRAAVHGGPAPLAAPGVLGGQVDLILGAVQPEPDRACGAAAIKVVGEHGLDRLGHRCPPSLADLIISRGQPELTRAQPRRPAQRPQVCPEAITPDSRSCPG